MFTLDPGFYPTRIPDLTKSTKKGEKFVVLPFLRPKISQNCELFHFWTGTETKFEPIDEEFIEKIVTKLSKIWVGDPGSRKNPSRIPDPDQQH